MTDRVLIDRRTFTVEWSESAAFSLTQVSHVYGIDIYRISIQMAEDAAIEPVVLHWEEPMQDIYCSWTPLCRWDHSLNQWFHPNTAQSSYSYGTPVLTTINNRGTNALTMALSDAVKPMELSFYVDDLREQDRVVYEVRLLDGAAERVSSYETFLRIDTRRIRYEDALKSAGTWMRSFLGSTVKTPEAAEMPLYSSWYNFHQVPDQALLEKELEEAAKMGFRTVILDDGWQFDGPSTGDYRFCGIWETAKTKFPDFAGFVQHVHQLGMKLLVWFPVPFVGYESPLYAKFRDAGQILHNRDFLQAGILDIRYKEVRQHIIRLLKDFSDRYHLDGLKLDFIDSFRFEQDSSPFDPAMDQPTVEEAVKVLLDEIYSEVTADHPDYLLEFRQAYIGTEILNHCNIVRVSDCAFDANTNRIGISALRLLCGTTAVHSDMLLWSRDEEPENCAKQLLNIMFGVPQISVLLTKIPKYQKEVIRNYLEYWSQNRDTLLHGSFCAPHPEANYPLLWSERNGKKITVLYSTSDCLLTCKEEDVFNCTEQNRVLLDANGSFRYCCYDCFGKQTESGTSSGLTRLTVPVGGRCSIVQI